MSYDITAVLDDGSIPKVELEEDARGGTHALGDEPVHASLNVTFNYGATVRDAAAWLVLYRHQMQYRDPPPVETDALCPYDLADLENRLRHWAQDGFKALGHRRLEDTQLELWWLVQRLAGRREVTPSFRSGGGVYAEYWANTRDNVAFALATLLGWSEQFPKATWFLD